MSSRRIVVVGASDVGCRMALAAHKAGHNVTLIDEHPQMLKDMSFDAPWFYGAALPAALMNDNSVAQAVLEASPLLMECMEADIDIRVSTVLWGAFRNRPNSVNIGSPKVGLVNREGNEVIEHDDLIITTGFRDFVPSFKGWDLPGVCGGKAAIALLDLYQVFEGKRLLVVGSSALAIRVIDAALAHGVAIAGIVEAGDSVSAGDEAAEWLKNQKVPVFLRHTILQASGKTKVKGAKLLSLENEAEIEIECDSIAIAIATLPNIELPAAMGCEMRYAPELSSWVPQTNCQGETSIEGVFWLSKDIDPTETMSKSVLDRLAGAPRSPQLPEVSLRREAGSDYIAMWVRTLHETGGGDVTLCQCETVSRAEMSNLTPPQYLAKGLRHAQSPVSGGEDDGASRISQDFVKRMTRVSMGHCQGKRCRDEAAIALSLRYGIDLASIKPASYRFPLRPIDLGLIADDDETDEIRRNWQMWPYETRQE